MRQRLGIARALLGAPDVLVLDEPTNGLDPQGIAEMRALLRRLADNGTTVFVSSHLLAEVEAMCDVVGVLARGRLVAEGPPSNLRPSGDRLRLAVDDPTRARAVLAAIPGVLLDTPANGETPASSPALLRLRLSRPATPAAVNTSLVTAGLAVSELTPEHERLEDVFLDLVGGADDASQDSGGTAVTGAGGDGPARATTVSGPAAPLGTAWERAQSRGGRRVPR
jgi:ABC-2 type transport system ATP-binding protein